MKMNSLYIENWYQLGNWLNYYKQLPIYLISICKIHNNMGFIRVIINEIIA